MNTKSDALGVDLKRSNFVTHIEEFIGTSKSYFLLSVLVWQTNTLDWNPVE
jgi:hypothetical protein